MPYKNIVFVKFRLELLSDTRFLDDLDDTEKLLYLGLLLLAGLTRNNIPNNPTFIKRHLNLSLSEAEITQKIAKIRGIFPKLLGNSQNLNFKNFNRLHNWIGNEIGEEKDSQDKIRIDKIRIRDIISYFTTHYKQKVNSTYIVSYSKDAKIIRDLLTTLTDDEIKGAITNFFNINDPFIEKAGYTIGVFKSVINRIRIPQTTKTYV